MASPLILIAEDERDIRELIVITLRTHGLTNIIQATNGKDAVAEAKARKPVLILMDVRMPQMTGYEACEILKDDPDTNDIPIVFLSAKGQETEIRRGIDLGAEEYILKPFSPDELYQRVVNILGRSGHQVHSP
jgi:CheY-like chemotaxis protein